MVRPRPYIRHKMPRPWQTGRTLPTSAGLMDFPTPPVDPAITVGQVLSPQKARPMKIRTLILAFAAVVALGMPRAAHSQDFAGQMVSWFTGNSAGGGGACYAEDMSCTTGACGSCNQCCHSWDIFGSAEALLWWGK